MSVEPRAEAKTTDERLERRSHHEAYHREAGKGTSAKKRHVRRNDSDDVELSARAPLAADANTKGLPTFPIELHLEILSYLPSVPIPCMQSGILSEEYRIKFDTMFALSQTCRVLYHLLKPLLWETLEACALRTGRSTGRPRAMATELVLWLEVVTVRAPELASYVRVFNVALTTYSACTVYQEFTRCLQLLPNLHTLQIVSFACVGAQEKQMCLRRLSDAFKGDITLPSIHTLTIPLCIYEKIVASDGPRIFPNLRHLNFTDMGQQRSIIFKSCNQEIHSLQLSVFIDLWNPDSLSLVNEFPHLRITPRLRIWYTGRSPVESEEEYTKRCTTAMRKTLQMLSRLTRLHTIRLYINSLVSRLLPTIQEVADPLVMDNACDEARRVILRNLNRVENVDVAEGKVILVTSWTKIMIGRLSGGRTDTVPFRPQVRITRNAGSRT
ncbi:hypothetical protein BDZ89DRAFT_1118408 [Hymenopellis radicata]|nr:hypothetical protein BDZ89DRAFT_1118408 [Hymenopellis radicata]